MADEAPTRTRVYLTIDPIVTGQITEAFAEIRGGDAVVDVLGMPVIVQKEGINWHRQLWAAQNYACQVRDAALAAHRAEVDRLERLDFGRRR